MVIKCRNIHVCTGDLRYIYTLPVPADDKLALLLGKFGPLNEVKLRKGIIWTLDSNDGMKLLFQSGRDELDARFRRDCPQNSQDELESLLKGYYQTNILKET
jgi:hypothetical protein